MLIKRELNNKWQFRESGKSRWRDATVPGCVQMDLMEHGELPDPFYRMNEREFIDIEPMDWDYKTEFTLRKEDFKDGVQINIVFEGLDTFCELALNDIHLGNTRNMFIPHRFDITDRVREGKNTLMVHFNSPIKESKAYERTSHTVLKHSSSTEPSRPYARKAQYSFGWNWSPRIMQTGIWRKVYLEFVDRAKLESPFVFTKKIDHKTAWLELGCEVQNNSSQNLDLEVEAVISLGRTRVASVRRKIRQNQGTGQMTEKIAVSNPELWYPNGMGSPTLYEASFSLFFMGRKIDNVRTRFGIRTVRLLREKDKDGESFIIEINGIKTFCKGANWAPADSLLPRVTDQDYRRLVALSQEANMNMLRVWGGGVYESDTFYEACDEMGIMVWQDFMYACAEYPNYFGWFRDLANDEAVTVVKRLRNHPSIVLWCGNNENQMFQFWWGSTNRNQRKDDIFKHVFPDICAEHDPSRPYWISSPYGGKDPNSQSEGDRHSWDVWIEWGDFDAYRNDSGRFVSEFGFQSMPNWKTVLSFTHKNDRHLLSQTVLSHNKFPKGMERLVRFLASFSGLPTNFRNLIYLTQFNHAEAIKYGVGHWRSRKFRTSGTLFWQHNDCWPVISWSSIDYFKRKKALWYYARKFFANVSPVMEYLNDRVSLTVVSDLIENKKAQIHLRAYKFDGRKTWEKKFEAHLPKNSATVLEVFSIAEFIDPTVKTLVMKEVIDTNIPTPVNRDLLQTVLFVTVHADGKKYEDFLVFDKYKNLELVPAKIGKKMNGNTLTLTSDKPVFGLFIETEKDVDMTDNCLTLEPRRPYQIKFSGPPGKIELMDLTDLVPHTQKIS